MRRVAPPLLGCCAAVLNLLCKFARWLGVHTPFRDPILRTARRCAQRRAQSARHGALFKCRYWLL